jgi:hypothetical protein
MRTDIFIIFLVEGNVMYDCRDEFLNRFIVILGRGGGVNLRMWQGLVENLRWQHIADESSPP